MGRGLSRESHTLIERAYEVLAREHPNGIRRVCYALFGNQAGAWTKKMSKLLTRARKDGIVPCGLDRRRQPAGATAVRCREHGEPAHVRRERSVVRPVAHAESGRRRVV